MEAIIKKIIKIEAVFLFIAGEKIKNTIIPTENKKMEQVLDYFIKKPARITYVGSTQKIKVMDKHKLRLLRNFFNRKFPAV